MFIRKLLQLPKLVKIPFYSFAKAKKDLYQILGVTKGASQGQIKKAYYKVAQEFHPDKNSSKNAQEKFSQANNAYQVLSDKKKRQTYDQTGSTQQNIYSGFENEDIFSSFAKGFNGRGKKNMDMGGFESIFEDLFGGGGGGGFGSEKKSQKRGSSMFAQDINIRADLTFDESVKGVKKEVQFKRRSICSTCKGNRAKPGTKSSKCGPCNGKGSNVFHQGPMVMRLQCQYCHGQGTKIETPCTPCRGSGIEQKKVTEEISFPKGIDNGNTLRFRGKGHVNADLTIKVTVRKNPKFIREGYDAHMQQQISVLDAVLGTTIQVQTIYGQKKNVKIEPGSQEGLQIRISRQGFHRMNSSEKGNHIITLKIAIPKKLTKQEKSLYEKLKEIK